MKKLLWLVFLLVFSLSGINCAKKEEVNSEQDELLNTARVAMSASDFLTGTVVDYNNGTATETINFSNGTIVTSIKYNSLKGNYKNATIPGDVTELNGNISFTNYTYAGITISGNGSVKLTGNMYYYAPYDTIKLSGNPLTIKETFNYILKKDGKTHTLAFNFDYSYGTIVAFSMQIDSYSFSYSQYGSVKKSIESSLKKNLFGIY